MEFEHDSIIADEKPGKLDAEVVAIAIAESVFGGERMTADDFISRTMSEAKVTSEIARQVFFDFCERGVISYNMKDGVFRGTALDR